MNCFGFEFTENKANERTSTFYVKKTILIILER